MLVRLFDGRGLTTPKSKIPCIEPNVEPQSRPSPVAGPSNRPPAGGEHGRVLKRPPSSTLQVIQYPPRKRNGHQIRRTPPVFPNREFQPAPAQLQPIRAQKAGIVKRRREPSASKSSAVNRPPPKEDTPALETSETILRVPGRFVE
ncbi:hypothetical protein HIM_05885 [Hirsutella minnesotensis 3608]|uniref:Uncharacterized protein n=1 Tax=Hirsutella minnesotensis 3608 TaxID=1043627 RepID=A0A0F7ZUF4_9HYPO|nr:hypothetical protein HIM_05885 [Hirsutella minnesotensis 3608]